MTAYQEKLQNPKWQRKRLSVFERDNHTCQLCKDTETTLQVHHLFYAKGYEPWDYKDEDLITYCKHCHALVEFIKQAKAIHQIREVFKYSHHGKIMIFCIVSDIQNQNHCCVFEYHNDCDDIEAIISMPEHIIERVSFLFNELKENQNAQNSNRMQQVG